MLEKGGCFILELTEHAHSDTVLTQSLTLSQLRKDLVGIVSDSDPLSMKRGMVLTRTLILPG